MAEKKQLQPSKLLQLFFLTSGPRYFFPNIYHGQSFALVKLKS
ncbi:hypothetical protein Thi970DRAFT_01886 [Thiorhodovibrio frisius]|uniref:Uncharacterized protein n=1 Tax=Thiorhodovibrio frisius TaxID=631362 RepID=H8Z2T0_9GAMM|nr:hypothetical protein Thi970DRAFT_01886 [Thiorhodovibrio frisius]WPL21635.1 hypothetical protein Thiofri_01761 [Thiorhodovibrio frisius]